MDIAESISEAFDGGFFVCFSVASGQFGDYDFFVSRLDDSGDTLWNSTYGNSGSDYVKDLVATPDGGLIFVGTSASKAFAAKISANGELEWINKYDDASSTSRIIASNDGNYWIAVEILNKMGVLKIDPSGSLLLGNGFLEGDIRELVESEDNHLLISGYKEVLGDRNGILLKITTAGNFVWAKEYGGVGSNEVFRGLSVGENAYYAFGSSTINSTAYDALIMKFDTTGNIIWSKLYAEFSYESFTNGVLSGDNIIVSGDINGTILCAVSSATGTMVWGKQYGDSQGYAGRLMKTFDAGYAVVFSKTTFTNGSYDTYVVKTDSLGHSSDCHEVDVIYPNISVTFSTSPLSASIVSSTGLEVGNFNQSYGIEFYLDPKVNASSSILDVQCFGGSDGSIDVTTFGGKAPYTINWNNVTSSEDISNLTAGLENGI